MRISIGVKIFCIVLLMLFYLRQDMSNQIMLAEIGSYRYLREI